MNYNYNSLLKMTEEIWKIIDEYDTYSVSTFGNVRNDVTGRILKGRNSHGYLRVALCKNGIVKMFSIHRLVALAFIENPENKKNVDHINGIKNDNNLTNLRWATDTENGRNTKIPVTNTSGVKGVNWNKAKEKWCAQIKIDGKNTHLGYFENLEEAAAVRQKKVAEHFGEFTHSCEKSLEV